MSLQGRGTRRARNTARNHLQVETLTELVLDVLNFSHLRGMQDLQ